MLKTLIECFFRKYVVFEIINKKSLTNIIFAFLKTNPHN